MLASQLQTFVQNCGRSRAGCRAVIVTALLGAGVGAHGDNQSSRYITRFEVQRTVEYQPKLRVVEQTVARTSWNPFRAGTRYEKRLVPIVSWVATDVERRMPVTDRVALHEEAMQGQRFAEKKNPRLAAKQEGWQTSGVKSIDRVPTRNFQTRSIGDSNFGAQSSIASGSSDYGGVQSFESDVPRVGMRFQNVR